MAKTSSPPRSPSEKIAKLEKTDDPTEPAPPVEVTEPLEHLATRVKITVDRYERGTALFATCGRQVIVGENRKVLTFDGLMLYWTRKQWSEIRSETAILMTNGDLLIELERAKRAAPFQADAGGVIVEWKHFLS